LRIFPVETIQSLDALSLDELDRLHETLAQRYQVGRGNVLEIGFGIAEQRGRPVTLRRDEIVFHVADKGPNRRRRPIPAFEEVRIRRGRRYLRVRLPTDVVELDRHDLVLTGREIHHQTDPARVATASVVLVWRLTGEFYFRWNVITVGHLFWSLGAVPESTPGVRIRAGQTLLDGRLVLRTRPGAGVDVALVEVQRGDLIDRGILPGKPSTRGKTIRSISDLAGDRGETGSTRPRTRAIPLQVLRYFPRFRSAPQVGPLFHVLTVRSGQVGAFGTGHSGALWQIRRQLACQQVFAWQSDGFRRAGGQSIHYALRWIQAELAEAHGVSRRNVTLRIVRFL
jgi:hypothetical protein